jgi:hypothetical protein
MKQLPTNSNRYFLRTSIHILVALMTLSLASCASNSKKDEEEAVPIMQEDYPTLATVEYVIDCVNRKGAEKHIHLYQCTCQFDKLAERMSYDEYSQAIVFRDNRSKPGENGAVFRDPPQAKVLRDKLSDAQAQAQVQCEVTSSK